MKCSRVCGRRLYDEPHHPAFQRLREVLWLRRCHLPARPRPGVEVLQQVWGEQGEGWGAGCVDDPDELLREGSGGGEAREYVMKWIRGLLYYTADDAKQLRYIPIDEPPQLLMPPLYQLLALARKYDVMPGGITALRFTDKQWHWFRKPDAIAGYVEKPLMGGCNEAM